MPAVRRLTGPSRENAIDLIAALARGGASDPTIGRRLGLNAREVAALRRDNDIPAGERRWLGAGR